MSNQEPDAGMLSRWFSLFKKISLAGWIIMAMALGIANGLFFGESCAAWAIVGRAFVAMLQISVLPYIFFSLICSFGGLNYDEAKMLSKRGIILIAGMWAIVFVLMSVIPQIFPDWKSATFFSSSVFEEPMQIDYISVFIPSNPFYALANNVVPAVTVFSILCGVALIGVKRKRVLLDVLDTVCDALSQITLIIVKLTPLGVFAIVSNVAGTIRTEEIGRIEIYFIAFWVVAALLGLLVFPLCVMMFTPFKYRDIFRLTRDALLTVLLTNNLFIVLPLLTCNLIDMFKKYDMHSDERESLSKIIVPVAYIVPCAGQLLDIIFIHFAAWYSGTALAFSQYFELYSLGMLALFGNAKVAITFLLQSMGLSSNLFQIYMVSTVINDNIRMTVEAIAIYCLALICICWMTKKLRFSFRRFWVLLTICFIGCFLVITAAKIFIVKTLHNENHNAKTLAAMKIDWKIPYRYFDRLPENPPENYKKHFSRLQEIFERKVLRVGVDNDAMPFSFVSPEHGLVGYDIEMAQDLALRLNCERIEFYQINYDTVGDTLNRGLVDIVMSELSITDDRIGKIAFTSSYMQLNMAVVVHEIDKDDYQNNLMALNRPEIRVGTLSLSFFHRCSRVLDKAKVIEVTNPADFFTGKVKLDAFVMAAEEAYAWRILYPGFAILPVRGNVQKDLIAYGIANGDPDFLNFVNYWLELRHVSGNTDRLYDYWVLGKNVIAPEPRWCIVKDVLHW